MLSIGMNRKLGRKIGVLNLPAGITCPGKTALCTKICYARKAEKMYKTAAASRARNLLASMLPGFVDDLVLEIQAAKLTRARLHESGDVKDQGYLDKLFEVCNRCPTVEFLAYTKSWHLDWHAKPANLRVLWSVDKTTTAAVPAGRVAYTVAKGDLPPAGYITCMPGSTKNYCGVSCHYCWLPGGSNIYFTQH